MPVDNTAPETVARANLDATIAGFSDLAAYLRTIDDGAWDGPSACTKWTVRELAGHAAGEAVWFPNLMRGITQGEEPLPASLYDEIKTYSREKMASTLQDAARQFRPILDAATPEQLEQPADLGFAKWPLWQATYVSTLEATFHEWDARAIADETATIPVARGVTVARGLARLAPYFVHKKHLAGSSGTFLFRVGDGIGPVTVSIQDGKVTVEHEEAGKPDVTLTLAAEQYDRLIAGRLRLDSTARRDRVQIDGEREHALTLTRVFGGIANES